MRNRACCLLVALLACAACGSSQPVLQNPVAPSAPLPPPAPPPAPPPPLPPAPISLGETVTGVVNLSDPGCDPAFPFEDPCKRFSIAIPTTGTLKVHVASPGPRTLTLRVGTLRVYGMSAVSGSIAVQAGSTYEISVALHDHVGGDYSQPFELTSSLDPQ